MDQNTRLIKFSDGTMIVCMVEGLDDLQKQSFINVLYPIEVMTHGVENMEDNRAMEQYSLKQWMGLSDDVMFTLNAKDITVISTLRDEYKDGYENVVNRLYFNDDALHESLPEDELTPEDLLQYLQAKDEGKLN